MYNFEYFADWNHTEARREYEEWLDEQDDFMVRCHEQDVAGGSRMNEYHKRSMY